MNQAISDFSGGVTTRKRVRPGDRAVMKTIDGYVGRSRALEPIGGVHRVGTDAAPTLATTPRMAGLVKSGSVTGMVATGATKLKLLRVSDTSPAWEDTVPVPALADVGTTTVNADGQMIIPTTDGIRKLEPAVALASVWAVGHTPEYYPGQVVKNVVGGVLKHYVSLVQHAPTAANSEAGNGSSTALYWLEINSCPLVSIPQPVVSDVLVLAAATNISNTIANTTTNPSGRVHSCDATWVTMALGAGVSQATDSVVKLEGSASIKLTLASVAVSTGIIGTVTDNAMQMDPDNWYVWSIYNPSQNTIVCADGMKSGLKLTFYTGADCVTGGANYVLLPALRPGWNRLVISPTTLGDPYADFASIALSTTSDWAYTASTIVLYLDRLKQSFGKTLLGNWEDIDAVARNPYYLTDGKMRGASFELKSYKYLFCWMGPSHRAYPTYYNPLAVFGGSGTTAISWEPKRWNLSNPGETEVTVALVGPGQKVTATKTATQPTSADVSHAAIYRADINTSSYQFVGIVAVADLATGLVDTGAIGAYDEALGLREFLESTHDELPKAKYAMYADKQLYGAYLHYTVNGGWRAPTAIFVSTVGDIAYCPRAPQVIGDGTIYDNYAKRGTEVRELIAWNGQKLVFLDNELFLIAGLDTTTQFVYIGPVGCSSGRSVAAGKRGVIWHGVDDFYLWDGSSPQPIGRNVIDGSAIDWTAAHDAIVHDDYYVLYCKRGTAYELLIFDMIEGGWYTYTLPRPMLGIVGDSATNKVWGLTGDKWPVQLFYISDLRDLKADGTYQNHGFVAETAYGVISAPGFDSKVIKLLADFEATADLTLPVTVTAIGKGATQTDTISEAIDKDIPQYEIPLSDTVQGRTVSVKLNYTGATSHSIIELDAVATGKTQR